MRSLSDLVGKYLCCIRDKYHPIPRDEDFYRPIYDSTDLDLNLVWFAEGQTIDNHLELEDFVEMMILDKDIMKFKSGINAIGEEISHEFRLFCCIPVKRKTPKKRLITCYQTMAQVLVEQIRLAHRQYPVSFLSFSMYREYKKQWDLRRIFEDELRKANLETQLLAINGTNCEDVSVLWETIRFNHLAFKNISPVYLTDKMLSCGFLAINGPIANPEALINFSGFGIMMPEEYISNSRLLEEIKKWKSDTPCLQFISIIMQSEKALQSSIEQIRAIFPDQSFIEEKPFSYGEKFSVLRTGTDESAVFVTGCIVSFAVGDWKKWTRLIEHFKYLVIVPGSERLDQATFKN